MLEKKNASHTCERLRVSVVKESSNNLSKTLPKRLQDSAQAVPRRLTLRRDSLEPPAGLLAQRQLGLSH